MNGAQPAAQLRVTTMLVYRKPEIRWPVLIAEMQDAGFSLRALADALDVPKTTLQSWKAGREPGYEDGRALLELVELLAQWTKSRTSNETPMNQK